VLAAGPGDAPVVIDVRLQQGHLHPHARRGHRRARWAAARHLAALRRAGHGPLAATARTVPSRSRRLEACDEDAAHGPAAAGRHAARRAAARVTLADDEGRAAS
jgi:hypothetical protein